MSSLSRLTDPKYLRSNFDYYFDWAYSGVDFTMEGNGGDACVNFIPTSQKIWETMLMAVISLTWMWIAYPKTQLPKQLPEINYRERLSKKIVLLIHSMTFGIELGYKLSTRQMIFVLNPCHMVTMIQIYLLVAPPTRLTMAIFRFHLHCLSGATIALLLPVTNTRLLPFETETYFIQHIMMLVVPFYLMRIGGVYQAEPFSNFYWPLMSTGFLFFYHWTFVQGLSALIGVNLNNMICPAVSDPFYGRWYRLCASVHQSGCLMLHGKAYTWLCSFLLHHTPFDRWDPDDFDEERRREQENRERIDSNGHAKVH